MTALVCEFADKLRFYDEVLMQESPRVFVAGQVDLQTGKDVQLEIGFGSSIEPLITVGKVVARVTDQGSGGSGQGVWVQLGRAQVASLKQSMHFDSTDVPFLTARAHPRVRCSLMVHVQKPTAMTVRCRDISLGGMCLEGASKLPKGQTLRLTIDFDLGAIGVFARVAWVRGNRVGLEFRFQNAESRQSVQEQIRRLLSSDSEVIRAKPAILAVDNDPATLRALDRVLDANGYTTLVAATGPDAIRIARQKEPTLIVLDVLLPGMNGLEVCRVLKRDAGTSKIPVALTSSLPSKDLGMLLAESGALAALRKPYRVEDLTGLVEKIIDQNQVLLAGGVVPQVEPNRRAGDRSPMFVRAEFQSDDIFLTGYLADASMNGAFFVSYWGDTTGSSGKITIPDEFDHAVEIDVEVRRRSDWGIVPNPASENLPGFGLKFADGEGRTEFGHWLEERKREAEVRPVVLLVDDDRSHLEIISVVLRYAGFAVIALDSPLAVANAVRTAKPSLVMLDYMMPGTDFPSLCVSIRQAAGDDGIPIWLHSSISDEHFNEVAAETGISGWVRKGTRPTEIAAQIAEFLGVTNLQS